MLQSSETMLGTMLRPSASSTMRGPGEIHIGDQAVGGAEVDADDFGFAAFAEVDLKGSHVFSRSSIGWQRPPD